VIDGQVINPGGEKTRDGVMYRIDDRLGVIIERGMEPGPSLYIHRSAYNSAQPLFFQCGHDLAVLEHNGCPIMPDEIYRIIVGFEFRAAVKTKDKHNSSHSHN
jgi:hypothetical protein